MPPGSHLHEDDGLRALVFAFAGAAGAALTGYGVYELAAWVWSWDAQTWQQLRALTLTVLVLWGIAWCFERMERAGGARRRARRALSADLPARRPCAASPRPRISAAPSSPPVAGRAGLRLVDRLESSGMGRHRRGVA